MIVLGVLVLVAVVSVVTYTNLAHVSLQFGRRATPARPVRRPLVELALAGPEVQDALGLSSSVVLKSSTRLCDIPGSIECFQDEYGSAAGDQVALLLARFTSLGDAVDFGLRMKYEVDGDQQAAEILVRLTPESFRWLDRTEGRSGSVYYGGANAGSIGMYVTWQPVNALSDDEAALKFSSLLDAQFAKIESVP